MEEQGTKMDELIAQFPKQLTQALKLGYSYAFSQPDFQIENVIVSGLGGSGIGGTIVQNYTFPFLKVPFVVNKTYDLPNFVGQRSLVVICSYSGNTEETISALEQAIEKKAFIVCITSGGKVEKVAKEKQLPCFCIPGGMPPRACLGYSLVQLLFVLHYAGMIKDDFVKQIEEAAELLEKNKTRFQQTASELADKLLGKLPVIYGANQMEGVAIRWRQQLNENSKVTAWENVVPEMNHNELVGWCDRNEQLGVIFLHTDSDHSKVKQRMEINKKIIQKSTPTVLDVFASGSNYWEQAFSLIHTGDWLSWYLSRLRKVDATEVKVIDFLKKELSLR